MKKILLSLLLCLCCSFSVSAVEFADVNPGDWHYPYISEMSEMGLLRGYEDGSFRPEEQVSLADFSSMIANAFYGNTLELVNTEVFDSWWEPYLYSCYLRDGLVGSSLSEEILKSTQAGYRFTRWDDYANLGLNRYDMVAMVANVLTDRYVVSCTMSESQIVLSTFTDVPSDSPYYQSLATAFVHQLVRGTTTTTYGGDMILSRAQAAVVLWNLVQCTAVDLETLNQAQMQFASPAYGMSSYNLTGNLDIENYIFARVNQLRVTLGLNPLVSNDTLVEYAYIRAKETVQYWSHTRPDGSAWYTVISPMDDENILSGENLTYGSGFERYEFADMIFKSWLNSPGHYDCMVTASHTELGIAVYVTDSGAYHAAQIFGR